MSLRTPTIEDGGQCWQLAVDSKVLDVNSRYAYLLWCRDFASTSLIAQVDGTVAGFVTGYRRPDEQSTLVIWQIAVAGEFGGLGIASAMLDDLFVRVGGTEHLETTITPDNTASERLFFSFARRHAAPLQRSQLFGTTLLGDGHRPENLHRIGPLAA